MDEPTAVGLIGAGSLAQALVRGLLASGFPAGGLWVTNRTDPVRLQRFAAVGVRTGDKAAVTAAADLLVLLVKPKDAAATLAELRPLVRPGHRILSCMAGISTAFIEQALGGEPAVLRAMPNVAAAVRASATALATGRFANERDAAAAGTLLRAVGDVVRVPEEALHAATAVAGSGPAYVFLLMEAMAEAAQGVGLPQAIAGQLVGQTLLGAARLAAESGQSPAELREAVTSPGGTTMAGLAVLREAGFREALVAAVGAAERRSRELGRQWQS